MLTLLPQLAGLALLLAGVWLCYRRWVLPRAELDLQSRGLLVLVILTLIGGGVGTPVWWADAPWAFSWDLPPLAGRMLGAAGWTFVVVCFLALERPSAQRLRLVLWLLAVYLAPLVVAILLFHLDQFDFAQPITYGFFVIAGGMSVATLWYLLRPPAILTRSPDTPTPPSLTVRAWLGLIALVTALWGLALFVTDLGPLPLIWVWPGDLLTSRLIAVMLLAIATGALIGLRDADSARLMLAGTLTYGLGIALASLWSIVDGTPIRISYLIAFGIIFVGSTALLLYERRLVSI
jgi:hypothetical protein